VELYQALNHRLLLICRRFNDHRDFFGTLDLTLPTIYGQHRRTDVDTRGELFFD
jgi:hypothetical protein